MPAPAKHRDAIVAAAARLFRRQGYAATGLAEILTASGAPKGSLYHYFPEGKRQVGAAAIALGGGAITIALEQLAAMASGPGDLLRRYGEAVAAELERSGWIAGCPIATILLEVAPGDMEVARSGRAALDDWAGVFERSAIAAGIDDARSRRLASLSVAAIEGGLIQARAAQASGPLLDACREIADLFDKVAAKDRDTKAS